jgi:hypothetical protein
MDWIANALAFALAIAAALLPHRHWRRMPQRFPMESAAFVSGVLTLFASVAIGLPAFLRHASANSSLALDAMLGEVFRNVNAGYNQGMAQGFSGLSIFTFLLLTPQGWLTSYLAATGVLRMTAVWFEDPIGDPILTGLDEIVWRTARRVRTAGVRRSREALEGPEISDRVVTAAAAGMADCDLVIVASRPKPDWKLGTVVFTADACYRIGEPVERTVAGYLRTLYPLTEHRDLEAIRRSVRYDLPGPVPSAKP